MGVLDGFFATWSKARETFGQTTPPPGSQFDNSSQLNQLQSNLDAARPGTRWMGGASDAYAAKNEQHRDVIGQLGGLDKRLATEVDNSAKVITAGRQNLDNVRQWVVDAANSVPAGKDREQKLMPIVSKGLGEVQDIVQKANGELNTIGGRIRTIGNEYSAFDSKKDSPQFGVGDEKGDKDEKSPEEQGKEDSEAIQNGTLSEEGRQRLRENTQVTSAQQAALNNGNLQLPPERMAYLQGFSRAFGDKTPADIKAIINKDPDGGRIMDDFELASNSRITTGLPDKQPPSIGEPSRGGKYALPDGIQKVLDGPVLTPLEYGPAHTDGSGAMVPGELIGASQPVKGLNDLADIMQSGNRDLQRGTDLDSGMLKQSQRLLEQSNGWAVPGTDLDSDRPRWYHQQVDPTLQNMFNAVNKDDMVIHDSIVGAPHSGPYGEQTFLTPDGQKFLDNLAQHQWQDDGRAAGGLFDWVGETAGHDTNNRAADTAHALAEFTSNNSERLLNLPGTDGQALGQVNPELTRDWARDFAPYYDDMVGAHDGDNNGLFSPLDPDGTPSPEKTRHLMSVLMSDQPPEGKHPGDPGPQTASEILFDSTKGHVEHSLDQAALSVPDPNSGDNEQAVRHAGRLQAALDLGTYDEAKDRLHDDFEAKHSAWETRSRLFDLGGYVGGNMPFPGAGQATGALALGKDFFIGAEPVQGSPPNVDLPDTYQIDKHIAETLIKHGYGDPSVFGSTLKDGTLIPPLQSGNDAFNEFQRNISKYLTGIQAGNPDPTIGFHDLLDDYWKTYTTAVNHGYQQK